MIIALIADGRSIHTQRWAEYFAGRGHEVHLITYDPVGRTLPGVTEHVVASRWKNLYLSFIPRHRAIQRLVRTIRPEIVHAHFIAKYGFHLPGLPVRPRVVSAWGDDILILPEKSRLIAWFTRRSLDSADLVYAVSGNIRDHILCDFSVAEKKVRVLPFGIDTDLFSPGQGPDRADPAVIRVFSNRGFYPVYDSGTLLRGFALACGKDPRLRLVLKGEGPEEQAVHDLVASLGLSDRVSFLKRTEFARVPDDYRQADIFITTSLSDGTPVSVLEAMATGLPCIATSVGGIPEWIEHEKTGILVPPSSPEQVADALLRLTADSLLRGRLGTAARERVVEKGQWKILMAQAEKDYQQLVKTYKQENP